MFRTTWKTVLANKRRLFNTFVSITFGVAFIAGTFIYGDTTTKAFENLFANAFAGVDINVQPESDPALTFGGDLARISETVVADVQAVDGIDEAWGSISGFAVIIGPDGEQASSGGAPSVGTNWPDVQADTGWQIIEGVRPAGPSEVAVDGDTYDREGLALDDTLLVLSSGESRQFKLVGVAGFGGESSIGGATFALFETSTAQSFLDAHGEVNSVQATVTADANVDQVIIEVQGVVPAGVEVTSGQTAAEEQARQINEQLGFLTIFLQVFAFVALFVSTFIIYNTFRIIVVQRTRELALLRALGATGRQVTRMVLVESLIVGLAASVIGVGLGLLLAVGLRLMLEAVGLALPSTSLQLSPRTVVVAILVGVIVTLISAFIPARKASRVAPVQAMHAEAAPRGRRSLTRRAVWGVGLLVLGIGLLFGALFADIGLPGQPVIATVGLAALLTVLGVTTLSPLAAPYLARWLAYPFVTVSNISGKLAQENSVRSPRRTAATAAALMIGVALMALAAVFTASIQGTIDEIFDTGVEADLFAQPQNLFSGGLPTVFADEVETLPEVTEVGRLRQNVARVDDNVAFIAGGDESFTNLVAFERIEGQIGGFGTTGFAVDFPTAEQYDWQLGQPVEFEFLQTGVKTLELQGLYETPGYSGIFISLEAYEENYTEQLDSEVYIKLANEVTLDEGKAAIEPIAEQYPTVRVTDQEERRSDLETQMFQILGFVFALLAMALLIALIGVANTITLSIYERTREIGLLRAVGLTRRGVRRMIRLESGVIAAFGAVLGIAVGVFLAWALLLALRDEGFSQFVIPWLWLVVGVLVIGLLGVVAAILPARRAANLNVLEAIAYH